MKKRIRGDRLFICQHQLVIVEVMTELENRYFANTNVKTDSVMDCPKIFGWKILRKWDVYMISKYARTDYLLITKSTGRFFNRETQQSPP